MCVAQVKHLLIGIFLVIAVAACGRTDAGSTSATTASSSSGTEDDDNQQLNLCILLDLSDRVEPAIHPSSPPHRERDIAVVLELVDTFRDEMQRLGAFGTKGQIRTILSPTPPNADINTLVERLHVDLREMDPAAKKVVYDSLDSWYRSSLERIYDVVLETKNYLGADIWRFFKEGQVEDYCISSDPAYRNVLLIVTDGYVYHEASTDRRENRTTYLTGPFLEREGLRRNSGWREKFENGNYGFIDAGRSLGSLEVLVAEIDPSDVHLNDFEILQAYWSKWLDEMGVTNYRLVKTDLPVHSTRVVRSFLEK